METHKEKILNEFRTLIATDMAVPVAAMNTLVLVISLSHASTWMQLEKDLSQAIDFLKRSWELEPILDRSCLSLGSGCEIFMKYLTTIEFAGCVSFKEEVLRRAQHFTQLSQRARSKISEVGSSFIQEDSTILVHGYSRVVTQLLLYAAQQEQKSFTVYICEGSTNEECLQTYQALQAASSSIQLSLVPDSGMAVILEEVDFCLVGAEAVSESGGIINKLGTYQLSLLCQALHKPLFVAVESFKFSRCFPLNQKQVREWIRGSSSSTAVSSSSPTVSVVEGSSALSIQSLRSSLFEFAPLVDFTPPQYISFLLTDLGVLTPSAVSEELIKLYQTSSN